MLCPCAAALASVGATVSVDNISLTVVDLRPDDRRPAQYKPSTSRQALADTTSQSMDVVDARTGWLSESTAEWSYESFKHAVSMTGPSRAYANIFMDGAALGDVRASAVSRGDFVLSPYASITFSADASVSLYDDIAGGDTDPLASASTSLQIVSFTGRKPTAIVDGISLDTSASTGATEARPLTLTLVNDSGRPMKFSLFLFTSAEASYFGGEPFARPSVVPEPQTWALMLLGLLALPLMRRREKGLQRARG